MEDRDLLEQITLNYSLDLETILNREGTKFQIDEGKEVLVELDLSEMELTEIPETVFSLQSLKILNLSHNYIDHVPEEIMELTELQRLIFEGNPESLPENFRAYLDSSSEPRYVPVLSTKVCTWCGEARGYRVENERTRGEFSLFLTKTHHVTMLICNNCKYIHHIFSNSSYFTLGDA